MAWVVDGVGVEGVRAEKGRECVVFRWGWGGGG